MTTLTPSRRQALRLAGGATLAAGAAVSTSAAPATAAKSKYRPGRYSATPILDVQARHLVNRFSYGITPELAAEVRSAGGHLAWFDQQLATAYDGSADNLCDWWPGLHLGAAALWKAHGDGSRPGWRTFWEYGSRSLVQRLTSPRQVLEVVAEFWENHFHVPTIADNVFVYRVPYGEVIRRHALGRFEDLLREAVLAPAMLMYLNAATSTRTHPNENLGRELLELHTVGIGNYTEDDVKNAARILTGWRLDLYKSWGQSYVPADHWTGPVRVMGFTDQNAAADGQDLTRRFLSYLAHHPATARRVATKLARQFIADDVPPGLIERLASTYLAHDTAIRPVLRELIRSVEFKSAVDQKLRDGDEDVLATYRLLGVQVQQPTTDESVANAMHWRVAALGLAPWTWPRPDGQPVDARSWSSPTRALASMALHWNVASSWPQREVTYRSPQAWLPRSSMDLRDLVDHLSRLLLHRPSTAALLRSCCEAVELEPSTPVSARSDLFAWRWPRLVAAILDSPAFYQH